MGADAYRKAFAPLQPSHVRSGYLDAALAAPNCKPALKNLPEKRGGAEMFKMIDDADQQKCEPCGQRVKIRDPKRYKTVLCNKWPCCPYGVRCQFAHGEEELRERAEDVKASKTEEASPLANPEKGTDTTDTSCADASETDESAVVADTTEAPGFCFDEATGEVVALDDSPTALSIRRQMSAVLGSFDFDDSNEYKQPSPHDNDGSVPSLSRADAPPAERLSKLPLDNISWTKELYENFQYFLRGHFVIAVGAVAAAA